MKFAKHGLGRVVAAIAVLVGQAVGAYGQPVAFVTDLQGSATLVRTAGSAPATLLTELPAGARVQLAAGTLLTALYAVTGDQFTALGPGTVLFEAKGASAVDSARVERRPAGAVPVVRLKAAGLAQGGLVMRSLGLRALGPSGVILSRSPVFLWEDTRQSPRYRFTLLDAESAVIHRRETPERGIRLPEGLDLRPGAGYRWELSALAGDTVVQTVRTNFQIAPADLAAQAEALRPSGGRGTFADRVAYAIWLEQAGLAEEARARWRELAAERPDEPVIKARAGS
jgi:hypothetical protein